MKIILKKNGSFFVWAVLPILFLVLNVIGVTFVSQRGESRVGTACSGGEELAASCASRFPEGAQREACLQENRDFICNSNRTLPCIRERCNNTACVADGADTSVACNSPNTCGNGTLETSAGEVCDQSATPNGCPAGQSCFNCRQCNPPITVITAIVGCGNGTPEGSETCDIRPGTGDPTSRTSLAPGIQPLIGACRPPATNGECTFCGDGQRQAAAGEDCDPRDTITRLADHTYCDNNCKIQQVPSTPPPAISTTCGDGTINSGEVCDPARTPTTGCFVNAAGREEANCISCQCIPWIIEGGGGSGGTKCSFSPAAFFSLSGILTELSLIGLVPFVIACCRSRKKK